MKLKHTYPIIYSEIDQESKVLESKIHTGTVEVEVIAIPNLQVATVQPPEGEISYILTVSAPHGSSQLAFPSLENAKSAANRIIEALTGGDKDAVVDIRDLQSPQ